MSEHEKIFLNELKSEWQKTLKQIIIACVIALIVSIAGGGWTMAKVFNVKGKADKEYVDKFYGDMFRIVETRILILEQMQTSTDKAREQLQKDLDHLTELWEDHLNHHMEKTRGENTSYYDKVKKQMKL